MRQPAGRALVAELDKFLRSFNEASPRDLQDLAASSSSSSVSSGNARAGDSPSAVLPPTVVTSNGITSNGAVALLRVLLVYVALLADISDGVSGSARSHYRAPTVFTAGLNSTGGSSPGHGVVGVGVCSAG